MEDNAYSHDKSDIKLLGEKYAAKIKCGRSKCLEKRNTSQGDDNRDEKEVHSSIIRSKENEKKHQNIVDGKKEIPKVMEIGTRDRNDTKCFPDSVIQYSESKRVLAHIQNCAVASTHQIKQQILETSLPKFKACFIKHLPETEQNELEGIIVSNFMNLLDDFVVDMINRVGTFNLKCEEKTVFNRVSKLRSKRASKRSKRASKKRSKRASKKRSKCASKKKSKCVLKKKLKSKLSGTSTNNDHGEHVLKEELERVQSDTSTYINRKECALSKKSKCVLREKLISELSDTDCEMQPKHKKYKIEENVKNFVGSSEGYMEKRSSVNNGVVNVCDLNFENTNNISISDDNVKINESHCSNKETSDAEKNDVGILDLPDMVDNLHMKQNKKTKRSRVVENIRQFKSLRNKKKCNHLHGKLKPYQGRNKFEKNLKVCSQNNNLLLTSANLVTNKSLLLNKRSEQEVKDDPTFSNVATSVITNNITLGSLNNINGDTVSSSNSNFNSSGNIEINPIDQYISDTCLLNRRVEENNNQPILRATAVESNITNASHHNVYNNIVFERQNESIENTMRHVENTTEYYDNYLNPWYNENRSQYTGNQNYNNYYLGSLSNNNYYHQSGVQDYNYSGNMFSEYQPIELPDYNVQIHAVDNFSYRNTNYNSWNGTRTMPQLVIEGMSSATQVENTCNDCPFYNSVNFGHTEFLNRNAMTTVPNVQNGTFNSTNQLYFQQYPALMTNLNRMYNMAENGNSNVLGMALSQQTLPNVLTIPHSNYEFAHNGTNVPNTRLNTWLINRPSTFIHWKTF